MRRAPHIKLLAVAAAVMLAACSGDSPTGPKETPPPSGSDPVAGNFTLTTANALALPFTLFNETGYVLQMSSSTIAMQTGGQFVLAMTTVETVAGFPSTFVDTTRGTWTQSAGAVTLTPTGSSAPTAASWDGVKLSFPMDVEARQVALVYRKDP